MQSTLARVLPFPLAGGDVGRARRYCSPASNPEPRRVSMLLMIGMVAVPMLFCWFLLRRGYARSTRNAGFFLAFAWPVLTYLVLALDYYFGGNQPGF